MLATAARQAGSEPGIDAVAPMAGIEKGGQAEAEHEQLDQENEEQGDGDEDHEEAEGNDEDDEDEELGHNEKACRELWLSTEDALAHVKTKVKWEYVEDDKKRHRVIREKYWRLVKQASIFANRTGVHVLLAAGRTE
ncbi:hypothetical protein CF326_g7695 [Tilletia indica]|nr:hypothetical protein CF326_g7695 [Tilletia indica]